MLSKVFRHDFRAIGKKTLPLMAVMGMLAALNTVLMTVNYTWFRLASRVEEVMPLISIVFQPLLVSITQWSFKVIRYLAAFVRKFRLAFNCGVLFDVSECKPPEEIITQLLHLKGCCT